MPIDWKEELLRASQRIRDVDYRDLLGLGSSKELWFQTQVAMELKRHLRPTLDPDWRIALEARLAPRAAGTDIYIGPWNRNRPMSGNLSDAVGIELKVCWEFEFKGDGKPTRGLEQKISADIEKLYQQQQRYGIGTSILAVLMFARSRFSPQDHPRYAGLPAHMWAGLRSLDYKRPSSGAVLEFDEPSYTLFRGEFNQETWDGRVGSDHGAVALGLAQIRQ